MQLKKIVVLGPESTGKSTLCAQLAAHYKSSWVPEYARTYLQVLDLSYIADAMCAESYPLPRWKREEVLRALRLYKNFLWQ